MKLSRQIVVIIGYVVGMIFALSPLSAEISSTLGIGEIAVHNQYEKDTTFFAKYHPTRHYYLLIDDDDILSQIEDLREQSKAELEPLVKQYMYTAETLMQLAVTTSPKKQPEKERLSETFRRTERSINRILAYYQPLIDSIIRQHTIKTRTLSFPNEDCLFRDIVPGKYRVYGIMTFSTTTLRWFEPITVKGGDRHTIYLTRENIKNPYWTDLNWWSFMNLEFRKHH